MVTTQTNSGERYTRRKISSLIVWLGGLIRKTGTNKRKGDEMKTVRERRATSVRWIVKPQRGIWYAVDTWNMRRVRFSEPEAARQHVVRMNAAG